MKEPVMKANQKYEVKEKITDTFLKTVSAFADFGGGIIQFVSRDDGSVTGAENAAEDVPVKQV